MINSKADLKYYLKMDAKARGFDKSVITRMIYRHIWKWHVALRKCEYYTNCRNGVFGLIMSNLYKYITIKRGLKLGWSVPPNVFGPGLFIVHTGTVVVNGNARAGKNCKIQSCVNIGANAGEKEAPIIGDNVYIGPGAKIFGNIKIGNNIAVGANAVVNKSFEEDNITIAGVPAKKISNRGSDKMIK